MKDETRKQIEKYLKNLAEGAYFHIEETFNVKGDVTITFKPKSAREKDIEATALYS